MLIHQIPFSRPYLYDWKQNYLKEIVAMLWNNDTSGFGEHYRKYTNIAAIYRSDMDK